MERMRNLIVEISAVAGLVGLCDLFARIYTPDPILAEGASAPEWVGWVAWLLMAIGIVIPAVYVVIDRLSPRGDCPE